MITTLALLLALSSPVDRQEPYWKSRAPAAGDVAPSFAFDEAISGSQPLAALSSASLRGRVVVLEFFGTWCRPCIVRIPELNELIEKTRDLPVTIVTVGNESREVLRAAVEKHQIKGPVVFDEDGSTFEDFWVNGLPSAAIIDQSGRLIAFARPQALTRAVLEDVVAGRIPRLETIAAAERPRNWDYREAEMPRQDAPALSARATIEEVERVNGRVRTNTRTGEISAAGVPTFALLRLGWDVHSRDVEFKAALPEGKFYNVSIVPPDGSVDTAKAMLRSLVEKTFNVRIAMEPRDRDVFLLTRRENAPPLPAPASDEGRAVRGPGLHQMRNATMDDFAAELRNLTAHPVVNRTGMAGRYSFDFTWDIKGGGEAAMKAIEAFGFRLEKGKAAVPMLVVNPR